MARAGINQFQIGEQGMLFWKFERRSINLATETTTFSPFLDRDDVRGAAISG